MKMLLSKVPPVGKALVIPTALQYSARWGMTDGAIQF